MGEDPDGQYVEISPAERLEMRTSEASTHFFPHKITFFNSFFKNIPGLPKQDGVLGKRGGS